MENSPTFQKWYTSYDFPEEWKDSRHVLALILNNGIYSNYELRSVCWCDALGRWVNSQNDVDSPANAENVLVLKVTELPTLPEEYSRLS